MLFHRTISLVSLITASQKNPLCIFFMIFAQFPLYGISFLTAFFLHMNSYFQFLISFSTFLTLILSFFYFRFHRYLQYISFFLKKNRYGCFVITHECLYNGLSKYQTGIDSVAMMGLKNKSERLYS